MNRYHVGLDVHKASIRVAVLNAAGKLVTESVVETGAAAGSGSSTACRSHGIVKILGFCMMGVMP